jgi:hypothetical protein
MERDGGRFWRGRFGEIFLGVVGMRDFGVFAGVFGGVWWLDVVF